MRTNLKPREDAGHRRDYDPMLDEMTAILMATEYAATTTLADVDFLDALDADVSALINELSEGLA